MKKQTIKSKVSVRTAICALLIIIGISSLSSMRVNATTVSYDPPSYSSLTPHASISITSDVELEVYPGSGTAEDPYVIEGYNITTTDETGIYITGTTKYFTVRNCYVDAQDNGIYISAVASGTTNIINNTCNNNEQDSIKLVSSSYSFVVNNTCSNNNQGIYVLNSEYSTIANNSFTNNFEGIFMDLSSYNIVADNICIDNDLRGIELFFTSNCIVTENTCNNNGDDGISISYSDNTTISNNTCNYNDGDGINLRYSDFSTLKENICNYNTGYRGIDVQISNNSTIIFNTCNNNHIDGIELEVSVNGSIYNNICNNNYVGIKLEGSVNGSISNNICIDNGFYGIEAKDSGNASISENTCNFNGWEGIVIENSDNAFVNNNTCSYNHYAGIYVGYTLSSTIYNNLCANNQDGIQLWYSHFQNITYNILRDNMEHGIQIDSNSDNNSLHHNNFINNFPGGSSQARDSGSNNLWYDTEKLEGNYWSDWSGIGSYAIDGFVAAVDLYPLNEPTVYLGPPVIIDVIFSPVSATELDTIEIEARITSPYGVQSVTLHYRVNGGTWIEVSMSLVSGDLYSCTIGTFAVDDIIEFYINATDATIDHNIAINDNSGVYYSFTILDSVVIPEFQSLSILILSTIVFLFSVVCLVIKKQKRK